MWILAKFSNDYVRLKPQRHLPRRLPLRVFLKKNLPYPLK